MSVVQANDIARKHRVMTVCNVRCVLDIVLFDCSYLPSRFNEYAESKAKNEKFSTQQTNNWNNKIQTQFWNTQKFDFVSFHKQQIATKF